MQVALYEPVSLILHLQAFWPAAALLGLHNTSGNLQPRPQADNQVACALRAARLHTVGCKCTGQTSLQIRMPVKQQEGSNTTYPAHAAGTDVWLRQAFDQAAFVADLQHDKKTVSDTECGGERDAVWLL